MTREQLEFLLKVLEDEREQVGKEIRAIDTLLEKYYAEYYSYVAEDDCVRIRNHYEEKLAAISQQPVQVNEPQAGLTELQKNLRDKRLICVRCNAELSAFKGTLCRDCFNDERELTHNQIKDFVEKHPYATWEEMLKHYGYKEVKLRKKGKSKWRDYVYYVLEIIGSSGSNEVSVAIINANPEMNKRVVKSNVQQKLSELKRSGRIYASRKTGREKIYSISLKVNSEQA